MEYYKAWIEFGSKDANKNVYWDPHKNLPKEPHWNIRYHPESLKSLQDTSEKPMKKLIECVLRLSSGKFLKEIINKQYLKITAQTGNGLWLTAMAGFIVTSAEETTLKGILIVISSSTKKAEAEKFFQNIAKSNDFFLDVENLEELLELTNEGSIVPKLLYPKNINQKRLYPKKRNQKRLYPKKRNQKRLYPKKRNRKRIYSENINQ